MPYKIRFTFSGQLEFFKIEVVNRTGFWLAKNNPTPSPHKWLIFNELKYLLVTIHVIRNRADTQRHDYQRLTATSEKLYVLLHHDLLEILLVLC